MIQEPRDVGLYSPGFRPCSMTPLTRVREVIIGADNLASIDRG